MRTILITHLLSLSFALALLSAFLSASSVQAAGSSTVVLLQVQQKTNWGHSVYVTGNAPALGNGDLRRAVRMNPKPAYPQWALRILVPSQAPLRFRFFVRSDQPQDLASPQPAFWIGPEQTVDPSQITATSTAAGWAPLAKAAPIQDLPPQNEVHSFDLGPNGKIEIHAGFKPANLPQRRDIRVWVPPGKGPIRSILYLQDGQNLFEAFRPGQSWELERTVARLIQQARIPRTMIVGIDSTSDRYREYNPFDLGAAYARFLTDEVIPYVENNYGLAGKPLARAVGGSSMGGLIALDAANRNAKWFNRVFALSPSLHVGPSMPSTCPSGEKNLLRGLTQVYLDSGTEGGTHDNYIVVNLCRDLMLQDGLSLNRDLFHTVAVGAVHHESAWKARLPLALESLLNARMP